MKEPKKYELRKPIEAMQFTDEESSSVASGEGRGARPRKRVVRKASRLGNIKLEARRGGSRRQRNAAAVSQAIRSGRKHVFLDLQRRKGIFRIKGGKRNPKLDMIWDITRPSVRIKKNPMLKKAVARTEKVMPTIYRKALQEQLRRHRISGI